MHPMRRPAAAAVTLALGTACGGDEPGPEPGGGTTSIEVTFEGGTVTPSGERVEVDADDDVELVVQADEGGELHVHTDPEQQLEYGAGTTTLPLTLDQPGVVEVESHELGQVIVRLEVR